MQLEKQVVSLELAMRLKESGIKQRSIFYWVGKENLKKNMVTFGIAYLSNMFNEKDKFNQIYSAFTVAELGEVLPEKIIDPEYEEETLLICDFYNGIKRVGYCNGDPDSAPIIEAKAHTEANARAKLLIYLTENGLLPKEL